MNSLPYWKERVLDAKSAARRNPECGEFAMAVIFAMRKVLELERTAFRKPLQGKGL
jgi:hypothetical protein